MWTGPEPSRLNWCREEKQQTFFLHKKKTIRSYAINLEHFNREKRLDTDSKPGGLIYELFKFCLVVQSTSEDKPDIIPPLYLNSLYLTIFIQGVQVWVNLYQLIHKLIFYIVSKKSRALYINIYEENNNNSIILVSFLTFIIWHRILQDAWWRTTL